MILNNAYIYQLQSEGLCTAAYKMNWYELKPRESKLLILWMTETAKPIEITIGKFSTFSLEYFCTVMWIYLT